MTEIINVVYPPVEAEATVQVEVGAETGGIDVPIFLVVAGIGVLVFIALAAR